MWEIIKSCEKYFFKSAFFRYIFLFYIMTLFVQILIARERGYLPSKYQYDFLLILNYTKEISRFIILMALLVTIEYGNAILPVICTMFNSNLLNITLRKIVIFIAFIILGKKIFSDQIDIEFWIKNYDAFFIIFFIIFFVEILAYSDVQKNKYTKEYYKNFYEESIGNFYFRLLIYAITILYGLNILYRSLK